MNVCMLRIVISNHRCYGLLRWVNLGHLSREWLPCFYPLYLLCDDENDKTWSETMDGANCFLFFFFIFFCCYKWLDIAYIDAIWPSSIMITNGTKPYAAMRIVRVPKHKYRALEWIPTIDCLLHSFASLIINFFFARLFSSFLDSSLAPS